MLWISRMFRRRSPPVATDFGRRPDGGPPRQTYSTTVAGVNRSEDRQKAVRRCQVGDEVRFIREPHNPSDANAVQVRANTRDLGYLPRDIAEWVAPKMEAGVRVRGKVRRRLAPSSEFNFYNVLIDFTFLD